MKKDCSRSRYLSLVSVAGTVFFLILFYRKPIPS